MVLCNVNKALGIEDVVTDCIEAHLTGLGLTTWRLLKTNGAMIYDVS